MSFVHLIVTNLMLPIFMSSVMYNMRAQACPTVTPVDCGPPDSSVHEISQAEMLEWVAISYSRGSSQPRCLLHWQTDSLPLSHQGDA